MFVLDVLAIVILFGFFFLIFGLISFSRCLVTAGRSKQHEQILEAPVPPSTKQKSGGNSEKIACEDHARDANSSSMSGSAQIVQNTHISSTQPFLMGNAGSSAPISEGQITVPASTRHEISMARMRFLIARRRVSARGLHRSDIAIRRQDGIDLRRR